MAAWGFTWPVRFRCAWHAPRPPVSALTCPAVRVCVCGLVLPQALRIAVNDELRRLEQVGICVCVCVCVWGGGVCEDV